MDFAPETPFQPNGAFQEKENLAFSIYLNNITEILWDFTFPFVGTDLITSLSRAVSAMIRGAARTADRVQNESDRHIAHAKQQVQHRTDAAAAEVGSGGRGTPRWRRPSSSPPAGSRSRPIRYPLALDAGWRGGDGAGGDPDRTIALGFGRQQGYAAGYTAGFAVAMRPQTAFRSSHRSHRHAGAAMRNRPRSSPIPVPAASASPAGAAGTPTGFALPAFESNRADVENGPRRVRVAVSGDPGSFDSRRVVEDPRRLADPHEPVLSCWERPPFSETVGATGGWWPRGWSASWAWSCRGRTSSEVADVGD